MDNEASGLNPGADGEAVRVSRHRMYLRAMITGWMSRGEQRARVAGIRAGEKHLT